MTGSTAKIFVTRRLPALIEERMAALFDTHFIGEDRPQTSEELIVQSQDCDILVSTIKYHNSS